MIVFEFNDDLLPKPRDGAMGGEDRLWCSISDAAKAELEALNGGSRTQESESGDALPGWTRATAKDAPSLNFDLEQELNRAFERSDAEIAARSAAQSPVHGAAPAPVEPQPQATSQPLPVQPAAPAVVPTEAGTDPSMEFSEMIADELDKALSEEVEADAGMVVAGTPASVDTDANIVDELSRIMKESEPAPPLPAEVAVPHQAPEIVDAPAFAQEPDPVAAAVAPTGQPVWTTDPLKDYSDPVDDFAMAGHHGQTRSPAPMPNLAGDSQMDTVLTEAAVLGAVANEQHDRAVATAAEDAVAAELATDLHAEAFGEDELDIPPPIAPVPVRHQRRSGRRVAFAVVAVALLGGAAAFAWSGLGGSNGPAPTILASSDPVKEKPDEVGGVKVPNQDQVVFQTPSRDGGGESGQQVLQDATEKPISVASKPVDVAKVATRTAGTGETAETGLRLQPRRVRTVVVRPDGTIISTAGNQGAAGTDSTSSETAPSAPAVAEPTLALRPDAGTTAATEGGDNASSNETVFTQSPAGGTAAVDKPVVTVAARPSDTTVDVQEPSATTPAQTGQATPKPVKIEDRQVAAVENKPVQPVKPIEPVATKPEPQAQTPRKKSAFAVQVASQRSRAAAQKSYQTLSRRYGSLLQGKGLDIQKAAIKGKGTFYRVRIPADTRQAANRLCSQLKARGGSCFVTR